ncbi:MAG: DUF4239 domain-containing protein [Pseudomonadota bacterium]
MFNIIIAAIVLVILFVLLSLSVVAGRRYGKAQLEKHAQNQLEVVIVAEGAVFTLLALLVAFAFSGAYERFENRKLHIIEEANAISTAYQRIDLLAPAAQPALRESFRQYVDAQLEFYKEAARLRLYKKELAEHNKLEDQIWTQTVAALKTTNDPTVTQVFLPVISNMLDNENSGIALTRIHPPGAIFILLIGLAVLSGFLAGYSTAESKSKNPIHVMCYIVITVFTIFIILNLEFPRAGVIRVDGFDQILVNVRDHMTQ